MRLTDVIEHRLARRVRPGLALRWIVPTRYDARRGLDREVVELVKEKHGDQVTSPVREAVAARDGGAHRPPDPSPHSLTDTPNRKINLVHHPSGLDHR